MADMSREERRQLLAEVIVKTADQMERGGAGLDVPDDFRTKGIKVATDVTQVDVSHGTDSEGRELTGSVLTYYDNKIVLKNRDARDPELVIDIAADKDDAQWISKFIKEEQRSIAPNISNRESNFRKIVDSALLHSALYRSEPSPAVAAKQVSNLVERHFEKPGSGKPRAKVEVSREGLPDLIKLAQQLSDISNRALERGGTKPEFEEVLRKLNEQKAESAKKTGEELLGDVLSQVSMPITPDMPATVSITGVDQYQKGSDGKLYVHFSMLVGIKKVGERLKIEVTDAQGAAKREVKSLQDLTDEVVRRANDNPLDVKHWRFYSESFSNEPFRAK